MESENLIRRIEPLLPMLQQKYGRAYSSAVRARWIKMTAGVLTGVLFPSLFFGFYRFAGNAFPLPVRIFGVLFFGGILLFISISLLEQQLLRPLVTRFPVFCETRNRRFASAAVIAGCCFTASWLVSGVLFQDASINFENLGRWALAIAVLIVLGVVMAVADRNVRRYREKLLHEVLVPVLKTSGWTVDPLPKISIDDLKSWFPATEQDAMLHVANADGVLLKDHASMFSIRSIIIRKTVQRKDKSDNFEQFRGVIVQINAPGIDVSDTGLEQKTLPWKEQLLREPLKNLSIYADCNFTRTDNTVNLLVQAAVFPASGAGIPKAWEPEWLLNSLTLVHYIKKLSQLITSSERRL